MDRDEPGQGRNMGFKRALGQVWLLLSAFGICFALLSSLQELGRGEGVKTLGALALGVAIYLSVGRPKRE